jgi:pimeloyl-ACP methyl ester carboxylesterase
MEIVPFTIAVPQAELDELQVRLSMTRLPDEVLASGWALGTDLAYLRDLVHYWRAEFDWRTQERALNTFSHFCANIDGLTIHFVRARGVGLRPLPLILTHGWPSSFVEMLKILPRLADPARFGGDPADAFDVVVPSLPGFAFSARPPRGAMTDTQIADVWCRLMVEGLGYERFCAHGSDVGGGVTRQLGRRYPDRLIGIHTNGIAERPTLEPGDPPFTAAELAFFAEQDRWDEEEGAYAHMQHTKPQTLAYGLTDSPAGLAAWIIEKFRAWSDCHGEIERRFSKDELLTTIGLYWLTGTINASFGPYFADGFADDPTEHPAPIGRIVVPCGVALFPKNMDRPPRELGERLLTVHRWTEMPRGGHFPALEEPDLLVDDLRAFFRPLRDGASESPKA